MSVKLQNLVERIQGLKEEGLTYKEIDVVLGWAHRSYLVIRFVRRLARRNA